MAARSLWTATASIAALPHPQLHGDAHADVAVVGGGFTGLSAALHLAEGGRSVVLLEAEDIGHGASGRNGGQVNPGLRLTEPQVIERLGPRGQGLFRLGEEATDFLTGLIERKGLHCSFVRPGVVRLAHNAAAMHTLEAVHRALQGRGVATRLLGKRDVEESAGTTRYVGGLFDPRGGNVQPLDLARELARGAGEAGAQIFTHSPVRSLSAVGERWMLTTPHGTATADQVIVCQ